MKYLFIFILHFTFGRTWGINNAMIVKCESSQVFRWKFWFQILHFRWFSETNKQFFQYLWKHVFFEYWSVSILSFWSYPVLWLRKVDNWSDQVYCAPNSDIEKIKKVKFLHRCLIFQNISKENNSLCYEYRLVDL